MFHTCQSASWDDTPMMITLALLPQKTLAAPRVESHYAWSGIYTH